MTREQKALLYLVRLGIGGNVEPCFSFQGVDWRILVDLSYQQGVAAIAVDGLQRLYNTNPDLLLDFEKPEYESLKYDWFGSVLNNEQNYESHCRKVRDLSKIFTTSSFRSCILKGVGLAQYYPIPSHRTCGDIDIWIEGKRDDVIRYVQSKCRISKPMIHHVDASFYPDTLVEVHYVPSWVYNPFANKRLQNFYNEVSDLQFMQLTNIGFAFSSIYFNLVFCIVHLYRHTFEENVSLKQLVDYYLLLVHSSYEERAKAYSVLCSIGLSTFVAWVMFRMKEDFYLEDKYLLCAPSRKCRRPIGEVIWLYPWKIWHWCWRKRKGYI